MGCARKWKRLLLQPVPVVVVEPVGSVTRTQRREFVRVRTSIPVELIGVPDPSQETKVVLLIKTRTLDLSGGGFAVHHKDAVPAGTIFDTRFSLPGTPEEFHLHSKLVRCERHEDAQRNRILSFGSHVSRHAGKHALADCPVCLWGPEVCKSRVTVPSRSSRTFVFLVGEEVTPHKPQTPDFAFSPVLSRKTPSCTQVPS